MGLCGTLVFDPLSVSIAPHGDGYFQGVFLWNRVMRYKIKNWDRFQHYKDRSPAWIKLHYEVLTSPDWVMLDDASKLLAVVIMLLASRSGGEIEGNERYIQKAANLDKKVDLKPLIECGFLIMLADASTVQANDTREEKRREEERRGEDSQKNDKANEIAFNEFWKLYPKARAGNKDKAKTAYLKALTRATKEEINGSVEKYSRSDEVARGYAKGAAAWLNDDRWTTNYDSRPNQKGGKSNEVDDIVARKLQQYAPNVGPQRTGGDNPNHTDALQRLEDLR